MYLIRLFFGLIVLANMFCSTTTVNATGCPAPIFNATRNYSVSSGARSLALGDFDGDGNLDVVLAHHVADYISVSLNDGQGGYGVANTYPVKPGPYFVVTGDFNEDGKLDIATAGYNNNIAATAGFVSILLGDGTGGFGPLMSYPVGSSPMFMARGDFNKDGHLDLVTANGSSSNISILIGDGKGSFAVAVNYAAGSFPRTVAVGDFNKDGNPDILVGRYSTNSVSLFLGNGTGTFGSATSISLSTLQGSTENVVIADFNGDGNQDFAVGVTGGVNRGVGVVFGDGTGGFGTTVFTSVEFPGYLSAGDLNGDDKQDIVVGNEENPMDSVAVLFGNGSGGFSQTTLTVGYNPTWAAIADLNKDGKADLAVTGAGTSSFSILFGDGTGKLGTMNYPEGGVQATYAVTGDFNGDGKPDVAVANSFSNNVSVLLNSGAGVLNPPATFSVGFRPESLVTGDFNGDRRLDLAAGNNSNGLGFSNISILLGDGLGGFGAVTNYSIGSISLTKSIATGDLNSDGKLDLVTANQGNGGTLSIVLGNGAGGFGAFTGVNVGQSAYYVALSDFNGDGKLDAAVANQSSSSVTGTVSIFLGNGLGGFGSATNFTVGNGVSFIAVADFNGDGKLDLATANSNPSVSILLGDGAGNFGSASGFGIGQATSLAVKDFNGDGKLDIAPVILGNSGAVPIYLGDGSGKFIQQNTYIPGARPLSLVADDFNGDGTPDLAVANYNAGSVSIMLNGCSPTAAQLPTLGINNATVTEGLTGTRNAVFTVTLSKLSDNPVTVDYITQDNSASSGSDFQPLQGQLTFAPGETAKNITVPVNGDNMWETDEYFSVKLSNSVNATIKRQQGLGSISNDDPIPTISISDSSVKEGDSGITQMNFFVTLSNPTSQQVSMHYDTSEGTATQNIDYGHVFGSFLITPGSTSYTISVPVYGDTIDENNETFNLTLTDAIGATMVRSQAVGFISDDDSLPSLKINDISVTETDSVTSNVTFNVDLSVASGRTVTVNYATANGTATSGIDYQQVSGILTFNPGETSKPITVSINGDTIQEANETFFVNLSNAQNALIADSQGLGTIIDNDGLQFSQGSYSVGEAAGNIAVTVTRTDKATAANVDYATSDPSGLTACNQVTGNASSRCDYATTVGTLRFAIGESSKTIFIPIVDDGYVEGTENLTIKLSNPIGTTLGTNSTAQVIITDNDSATSNPIVGVPFFVRQQYIDFLGRDPDAAGFGGWQNILNNCVPGDTSCDRIAVSAGFFRSPEFQDRGSFIFRFYPAALGRNPSYAEFMPDLAKVSGFLSAAQLEANKVAFVQEFMARPEFAVKYSALSNASFVDTLIQTSGLSSHPLRGAWIDVLNNGTATRAEVLRAFTESKEVYDKSYNTAFVVMQYFGYLRRDPDASYLTWIQILNTNGGDYRGMISGFMNSTEYVLRFGP